MRHIPHRAAMLAAFSVIALWITAGPAAAQQVTAPSTIRMPAPAGTVWKAIQGYQGATHVASGEIYALDLVREDGPTAGTEVLAPAPGTVWFAHAPGAGNGCFSIKIQGGDGLIVQMCHVVLHRALRPNDPVALGASLGTVGAAGSVGNNGLAHIHISMHRTPDNGVSRYQVPFEQVQGMTLEGKNLPSGGTRNQYACPGATCPGEFVSSNGPAAASTRPATQSAPTTPPSVPVVTPVAPAAPVTPPSPAPAGAIRVGARAVVANAGAGDCVNVREGPGMNAGIQRCLPDGARTRIVDGPISADGRVWWRLDGLGWAVENYLLPLAPSLEPGGTARVNAGRNDCLNVRSGPGLTADSTTCLSDGSSVKLLAGPIVADGVSWWQLEGLGWASGQYLSPVED